MKEFISMNSKVEVQQTARRVVTLQDSVPCMRGRESKIHMIKSTQVVVKNNNQEEEGGGRKRLNGVRKGYPHEVEGSIGNSGPA